MSFNVDYLTRITSGANPHVNVWYSYEALNGDTLATVIADGYFDQKKAQFDIGDIIHVQGYDNYRLMRVYAVSPDVKVSDYITFTDLTLTGDLTAVNGDFSGYVNTAYILLDPQLSAPTTTNGSIYYDTGSAEFKFRQNNSWITISGNGWLSPVIDEIDFTTAEPAAPSSGDRYINTVTGNSSVTGIPVVDNYIYEYNGTSWDVTIPEEGNQVWDKTIDVVKIYNGVDWVESSGLFKRVGNTITPVVTTNVLDVSGANLLTNDIIVSGSRTIKRNVDNADILFSGSTTFGKGAYISCSGANKIINPGGIELAIGDLTTTNTNGSVSVIHMSNGSSTKLLDINVNNFNLYEDFITTKSVIFNGENYITNNVNTSNLEINSGSNGNLDGARLLLYGGAHSTLAGRAYLDIGNNVSSAYACSFKIRFMNNGSISNTAEFKSDLSTVLETLYLNNSLKKSNDNSSLKMMGSSTNDKGAYIILNGANTTTSKGNAYLTVGDNTAVATEGRFYLRRANNGVISNIFVSDTSNNLDISNKLSIQSSIILSKSGSDDYINFHGSSLSSGYGFRQKSGIMEAKNSGGAWVSILHKSNCKVHRSADQGSTGAGTVTVAWDVEDWDESSEFDTSTYKFTALKNHGYLISGCLSVTTGSTPNYISVQIEINGSNKVEISGYNPYPSNSNIWLIPFNTVLKLTAGQYFTISLVKNIATTYTIRSAADETWMTISDIF